jgi:hypothetical protein
MSVANHRGAFRPVVGGTIIVQSQTLQAGTLGMVLSSDGSDRWLLTARHVIARANGSLAATDMVMQPDDARGSIGSLADVVSDPTLDCAAVKLTVSASRLVLGLGELVAAKLPGVGMTVMKSGWKTGVSEGIVDQVNGNEVIIRRRLDFPTEYLLAAFGDSGAVWVEAGTLAPVALHTRESAVGPHRAFASSLNAVLSALGLTQV